MNISVPEIAPLSTRGIDALEAAAEVAGQGSVGTFDILVGLIGTDPSGAWERVQLHSSWIDPEERNRFQDVGPGVGDSCKGIPLSPAASEGLRIASDLARTYDLLPVPPAAIALGIVRDKDSGAARTLLEEAEIGHSALVDLLQDELLDGRLENLEMRGLGQQAPSPGTPLRDKTTSAASSRTLAPPPDLSPLPAEDPALQGLLQEAESLGRRSRSGPWLFAKDDHLLELYELGGLDEPTRKRAVAEASLQLAFGDIPDAVPALAVTEEGEWLIVTTSRRGETLAEHMASGGPIGNRLPAPIYGRLIDQAARTLDSMHERGLVHRAVRPETLVFDPRDQELAVGGFAIGSLLDASELDRYRAPESFQGEIGPAVDQYALGVVARELLTIPGSPPLTGPVHQVLHRATAPQPGDRFPTVAAFGADLVKAIATETPRSLAERVAGLSSAKRAALAPTALSVLCSVVLLTAMSPGSSEPVGLVLITSLLGLIVIPGVIFGGVTLAGALRGRRRFLSISLAARPWVQFAVAFVLFARGIAAGDEAYVTLIDSLIYAYGGCALLAPARADAGAWLVSLLATWERRRIWPDRLRKAATVTLVLLAVAALLAPTVAKVFWNNFEFSSESPRQFGGPLTTVWNLRAALGSDNTAEVCDGLLTAAAAKNRGLCRQVAHVAGAVQRGDPASRRNDVFGAPGTFESFQVQELPASSNHRFWMLWTPQHKAAGWLYTLGPSGRQLVVMITRKAPVADPHSIRSTWLYEVGWNGHEWRVMEYRACRIGAPGTGKRPAACVITSETTRPELRKVLREAKGSQAK